VGLSAGTRLGPYEITGAIGAGGHRCNRQATHHARPGKRGGVRMGLCRDPHVLNWFQELNERVPAR